NFTEADGEASVYTCNRKLKGKMKKLGFAVEDTDEVGGNMYTIPVDYIQLRKPRGADMTDEEKEAARERLAEARKKAGIGEFADPKKKKAATKKKKKKAPEPEEEVDEEEDFVEDEDELEEEEVESEVEDEVDEDEEV